MNFIKLICDCGNEIEFDTIDEETGLETRVTDGEGQYATFDYEKFNLWQMHDVVGIVCQKCEKSIWCFC